MERPSHPTPKGVARGEQRLRRIQSMVDEDVVQSLSRFRVHATERVKGKRKKPCVEVQVVLRSTTAPSKPNKIKVHPSTNSTLYDQRPSIQTDQRTTSSLNETIACETQSSPVVRPETIACVISTRFTYCHLLSQGVLFAPALLACINGYTSASPASCHPMHSRRCCTCPAVLTSERDRQNKMRQRSSRAQTAPMNSTVSFRLPCATLMSEFQRRQVLE